MKNAGVLRVWRVPCDPEAISGGFTGQGNYYMIV